MGPNIYAYVLNGPINERDPLGLGSNGASTAASLAQQAAAARAAGPTPDTGPLVAPTPFDDTTIGGFSLFNLVNGNLGNYLTSVLDTLRDKGILYGLTRLATCPETANAAGHAAGNVATGVTVLATVADASGMAINGYINQASQNPDNVDPTMTATQAATAAGNAGMYDPYSSLYGQ